MDFVDQVDLKPVHAVHPINDLDAETNVRFVFRVAPPPAWVGKDAIPRQNDIFGE